MQIVGKDHKFSFAQQDLWKVKLMDKFQVEASLCKDGGKCETSHYTGTWSTVYDQAFKIELENGLRFLANFKYSLKPEVSPNPQALAQTHFSQLSELKTGDYGKFNSECDKTMIGFVQTVPSSSNELYSLTKHKIQCFYGI